MEMRNVLSYLLVTVFALQSTGINAASLSSLNNLVKHYELHKAKSNTTLFDFIDLHYGSQKQAHENEHEEHQNLPFQENHHLTHNCYFEIPQVITIKSNIPLHIIKHNFYYTSQFDLLIETDIHQPPKH